MEAVRLEPHGGRDKDRDENDNDERSTQDKCNRGRRETGGPRVKRQRTPIAECGNNDECGK